MQGIQKWRSYTQHVDIDVGVDVDIGVDVGVDVGVDFYHGLNLLLL